MQVTSPDGRPMLEHREKACTSAPAPKHLHAAHQELAHEPASLSLEVSPVQIGEDAADLLDHADEVLDLDLKGNKPISGVIRHDCPRGPAAASMDCSLPLSLCCLVLLLRPKAAKPPGIVSHGGF
jgi:hypothetical protein